jgi:hypothetical protein
MDTQQMMELLLAMREERKADREELIARMDANTKATLATLEMTNEIKEAMRDKRMKANIDDCIADIKMIEKRRRPAKMQWRPM